MAYNVLQIGYGDVRSKLDPALAKLKEEGLVSHVAVSDVKVPAELDRAIDKFYQIENSCRLPLDRLKADGFLGDHVLALVVPRSCVHHIYVAVLSPLVWRIGVEKPLDIDHIAAEVIAKQPNVWPIDHVLFKETALNFLDRCRAEPWLIETCEGFIGVYFETSGVNMRALDPITLDVTYHLANLVAAALAAAGFSFRFILQKSLSASYDKDDKPSGLRTASLMQGLIELPHESIPFLFIVGKGMPKSQKVLFIQGSEQVIDLSESGCMPHYRAIRELLEPEPNMRTTMDLSLKVLDLCVKAEQSTVDCGIYKFGTWPQFIEEAFSRGVSLKA